jgi:carbonic anhydrase
MHTPEINPEAALKELLDGNKRYVAGQATHPHQSATRRIEVGKGQHPLAAILTCSDSRVPPEILFDQGIGDVFIVRDAGNIADDVALGSLEYAAEHLGTPLIVVLGHSKCGAVTATVQGGEAPGHIGSLIKLIQPAVEKTKGQPGDPIVNAIKANVQLVVEQLNTCQPILAHLVKAGKLKIVGAHYDLDSGAVELV